MSSIGFNPFKRAQEMANNVKKTTAEAQKKINEKAGVIETTPEQKAKLDALKSPSTESDAQKASIQRIIDAQIKAGFKKFK